MCHSGCVIEGGIGSFRSISFYQKFIILIIYSHMLLFFEATTDLLVDLLPPPPQRAATFARVRLRKKQTGAGVHLTSVSACRVHLPFVLAVMRSGM